MQEMPVARRLFEFESDGKIRQYGGHQSSICERPGINMMKADFQGATICTCDNTPTNSMKVKGKSGTSYIPDGLI